jgi:CRP-like cAMP-binding protein
MTKAPGENASKSFSLRGLRRILLPERGDADEPEQAAAELRAAFGPLPGLATKKPQDELVKFLRDVALFSDFTRWELARLARTAHERSYRDGEYVYEQGRPGAALFLVRSGVVELTRRNRTGEEIPLLTLGPPASFSEQAAIGSDVARWTSAVARGPVSLVALSSSDLDSLSRRFPILANKILRRLAQTLVLRLQVMIDAQLQHSERSESDESKASSGEPQS